MHSLFIAWEKLLLNIEHLTLSRKTLTEAGKLEEKRYSSIFESIFAYF